MIWATISSQSCFCWLYRASPSLAAKHIITRISVLTIWWCPRVESSLCCWKRVFAMTSAFSWQNSISLYPASFCTPMPNFPVTPGISCLPTFAFLHTPVLLPGKSHGWRSLVGCSPWSRLESDMTERFHFHFPLSCIGEGNGNPLQCSCLENPMDGEAW